MKSLKTMEEDEVELKWPKSIWRQYEN
jgi:hypothetical protein